MSSERTLACVFFAAFRLRSAEFAGEMLVLLLEAVDCRGRADRSGQFVGILGPHTNNGAGCDNHILRLSQSFTCLTSESSDVSYF
jgi:hypothetical protein